MLLHHEESEELLQKVEAANIEAHTALLKRARARCRLSLRLVGSPPSRAELHRARTFLDNNIVCPQGWDVAVANHELFIVQQLHTARVFVCMHPWKPSNPLILWAAKLTGAWIISPSVVLCKPGPAVKSNSALCVKRALWVSNGFRTEQARIWLLLLECMQRQRHCWTLLPDARTYAAEKVKAQRLGRPASVVALLSDAEHRANLHIPHTFNAASFFTFMSRPHPTIPARTSLGLADL